MHFCSYRKKNPANLCHGKRTFTKMFIKTNWKYVFWTFKPSPRTVMRQFFLEQRRSLANDDIKQNNLSTQSRCTRTRSINLAWQAHLRQSAACVWIQRLAPGLDFCRTVTQKKQTTYFLRYLLLVCPPPPFYYDSALYSLMSTCTSFIEPFPFILYWYS